MSGNQETFDALHEAGRAWVNVNGTIEADTYDRLLSYLLTTVSHQHVGIATKKAKWWARAGHGLVATRGGVKRGRGVRPTSDRVIKRRPHALNRVEKFDLQIGLYAIVETMLSPIHPLDDPSDKRLKEIGRVARGHAGRPSIRQVQEVMTRDDGSPPPSVKVIATAYAGLYGTPRRAAKATALPSSAARDLFAVIDTELPVSRVCAVALVDLVRKLWEPSTPGAWATAKWRARNALREISEAGLLNIGHAGDVVIIGRSRRVPDNAEAGLRDGTIKLRSISAGKVATREGLWGTEEGVVAQVVAIAALDDHEVVIFQELATVGDTHLDADDEELGDWVHAPYAASRKAGLTQSQRDDLIASHRRRAEQFKASRSAGQRLMQAIWDGCAEAGVGGAFERVSKLPYFINKAGKDPLSATRIETLRRKLKTVRAHEDIAAIIKADARHRGRPILHAHCAAPAAPMMVVEPVQLVPMYYAAPVQQEPEYDTTDRQRSAPFFMPRFLFDDISDEEYDRIIYGADALPTAPRYS